MSQENQVQDIIFARRSDGARTSTRGPHTDLFVVGPVGSARKSSAPKPTIEERITSFASARRMTKIKAAVFRVVASHVLKNDQPLVTDSFAISAQAGVSYDGYTVERDKLFSVCIFRAKSVSAIGVDGISLLPRLAL